MFKLSIDPVTGCAHIKNLILMSCLKFRVCSNCESEVPKDIDEERINFCWSCGMTFDHADDDPKEE